MYDLEYTPEENQAALDNFVRLPVSTEMISYLAQKSLEVILCDQPPQVHSHLPLTPPASPKFSTEPPLPSVEVFITSLVKASHVQVPTLMTSLVYLSRLKGRLSAVVHMRCIAHHIFLASLIIAAKNLNDSSPKAKHWARYTTVRGYPNFGFSITEVNLMEKQLLFLLDWDLRINPEDLYHHLNPFLAPIREQHRSAAAKAYSTYMTDSCTALHYYAPCIIGGSTPPLWLLGEISVLDYSSTLNYAYEHNGWWCIGAPEFPEMAPSTLPDIIMPNRDWECANFESLLAEESNTLALFGFSSGDRSIRD